MSEFIEREIKYDIYTEYIKELRADGCCVGSSRLLFLSYHPVGLLHGLATKRAFHQGATKGEEQNVERQGSSKSAVGAAALNLVVLPDVRALSTHPTQLEDWLSGDQIGDEV